MRSNKIHKILGTACLILAISGIACSEELADQDYDRQAKGLTHYTMGVIYDMDGLIPEAISEYEKAATFDSSSYVIRLKLGANYARQGLIPEAIKELNLGSELNPKDIQAHYLLALIYSSLKQFDKAADEYETILKSFAEADPQNAEISGYLGQLYYSQKKYSKAIEQFEKIIHLDPKNAEVMYLLGSLYLETGNRQKAIELFNQSITADPEHDGSLNSLGFIYAEDGTKLDEALGLVQRAVKIDPENGAYLDSLGWIYYKKGIYVDALKYLQMALDHLKDPVVYEHMGDVYLKLNQIDNAKKFWHQSLELSPNQEHVLKKLDDLEGLQANK